MKTLTFLLLAFSLNCFSQTEEEFFDSGMKKYEVGDYKGAIADYTKAIELNPNYINAYLKRGLTKSKLEDWKSAIIDFNKTLQLDPKNVLAYCSIGIAKIMVLQKEAGCQDLQKAVDLGYDEAVNIIKEFCN